MNSKYLDRDITEKNSRITNLLLLRDNRKENLGNLGSSDDILDMISKAQAI